MSNSSRRSFLKQTVLIGAAAGLPNVVRAAENALPNNPATDSVILFQGDSITDGNRTRDNDWNHVMGHGYAYLISSRLWFDHPDRKFHFYNRGISGNTVPDLAKRWQTDTIGLRPNVLSILIGVNDVLRGMSQEETFSAQAYENDYRALLKQTTSALPNVKLVICEPFILPVGRVKEQWDQWNQAIIKRQAIAKNLAGEFNAVFVDFQQQFNNALSKAHADYWIWDGVHPMPAGHELMARYWLKVVNKHIRLV